MVRQEDWNLAYQEMGASEAGSKKFGQGLKEIPRRRHKTYHSTVKAMGVALSTVQ